MKISDLQLALYNKNYMQKMAVFWDVLWRPIVKSY